MKEKEKSNDWSIGMNSMKNYQLLLNVKNSFPNCFHRIEELNKTDKSFFSTDKLDKILPFMVESVAIKRESLFTDFLLSFPDSQEGEGIILSYFCNNQFIFDFFFEYYPSTKYMDLILRTLGDINEDGGSHEIKGIFFWKQIRNAISKCKGILTKESCWRNSIINEIIDHPLSKEFINNYYL